MKPFSALLVLFTAGVFQSGASAQAPAATYVSQEKVVACSKGSTVFSGPEYSVICYNRSTPGGGEAHANHAHVWYILEGDADLVTGGTILQAKEERPGEPRGPGIDGGVTHRLSKGDVIVIPAGTAHWYKAVRTPVSYYSVNVEKPKH